MTRLLAAGLIFCLASSAQAALTIDTNAAFAANSYTNFGWAGSGQSLTIESGNEIFDNIGFYFDASSFGRTFTFTLRDAPLGNIYLSTSFVVQSGINVMTIGQQFASGQQVFAMLDYNGFTGATVHFTENAYAGGTSYFKLTPTSADQFAQFDHRFIANFSSPSAAVPEPATFAMFGLGALGFGLVGYRRRKLAR